MAKYFSTGLLFVDVGICIYREINFYKKIYVFYVPNVNIKMYLKFQTVLNSQW